MTKPGVFDAVMLCAIRISDVPGTPVENIAKLVYADVYVGCTQNSIVKFEAPNAVARLATEPMLLSDLLEYINPLIPAADPAIKIDPGTWMFRALLPLIWTPPDAGNHVPAGVERITSVTFVESAITPSERIPP
jgi:hypothetical protein